MSTQENLPATAGQRSKIAKLGYLLGIEAPIETGVMSMAQAGRQVRHLSKQLQLRKKKRSGWGK